MDQNPMPSDQAVKFVINQLQSVPTFSSVSITVSKHAWLFLAASPTPTHHHLLKASSHLCLCFIPPLRTILLCISCSPLFLFVNVPLVAKVTVAKSFYLHGSSRTSERDREGNASGWRTSRSLLSTNKAGFLFHRN